MDDLEGGTVDPSTVREWVHAYLDDSLADGFELDYGDDEPDGEAVRVLAPREGSTFGFEFYADPEDVPDWIDTATDLPVRSSGAMGT